MVQWLRLCAFTARNSGSIPGWESKILQAPRCSQKNIYFKYYLYAFTKMPYGSACHMVGDKRIGILCLPSIETSTVSLPTWLWFIKKAKVKVSHSCLTLCDHMDRPWYSPGWNTGVGTLSLLQGIFLTQEVNHGLLCCRQILYQLSHKGNPRILEWVACSFSSRSS